MIENKLVDIGEGEVGQIESSMETYIIIDSRRGVLDTSRRSLRSKR